ncbi:MAG: antibiotic biosynthesis monooxygenase [Clostridia bacterium]|nr:antibiotic biosynthesis monooxygenase [Clostridia bacterium]
MAITIHIFYTGAPDHARQFAQEMLSSGIVDAIRSEEGNMRYEYFFPANDDSTVLLIDSWTSQEALDAHHASPMMQQIIDLREKYDLRMTVERYISDPSGIPARDQSFIKK